MARMDRKRQKAFEQGLEAGERRGRADYQDEGWPHPPPPTSPNTPWDLDTGAIVFADIHKADQGTVIGDRQDARIRQEESS